MNRELYDNPLITRYASQDMGRIWSARRKFTTWRQLWITLAESQKELGLAITDDQLRELRENRDAIDFKSAVQYEKKLRHDVMAHVHAYGDQCPLARKIIHWGATSCFVTDNTELILLRESLQLVRDRLVTVICELSDFAKEYRDLACLGFTHLQPAQPTTVGKRACLWANDFVMDLRDVEYRLENLQARGVQGTTGTQASFVSLFDGNHEKVQRLQQLVAEKLGFDRSYLITGQTYSRKVDSQILDVLSGIAQSAHKAATDLRLLASRKEIEEPFEKGQVGSSAMAYKRNPMRCERICGLARYVISLQSSAAQTMAVQWMERTLDDSSNRRLVIPQALLAVDAILLLYQNIASGFVVYPEVVRSHLQEELPFLATEVILMAGVAAGGDRQLLHERIRVHSQEAARRVKEAGKPNDLLERLAGDEAFANVRLDEVLASSDFVGRAPRQVDQFVEEVVGPIRQRYSNIELGETKIHV